MDIDRLFVEYEGGRKEVKEYPYYGTHIPLCNGTRRKRAREKHVRYMHVENDARGFQCLQRRMLARQPRCSKVLHRPMRSRKQHVHTTLLHMEDRVLVDSAVAFIESSTKAIHTIQEPDRQPINVLVERHPGCTLCFTLQASSTGKDVKQAIEQRTGTLCAAQRLRHRGRPIKECQTLSEICNGERDLRILLFEGGIRGGAPPDGAVGKGEKVDEKKTEVDPQVLAEMFSKMFNKPIEEVMQFAMQNPVRDIGHVETKTETSIHEHQEPILRKESDNAKGVQPECSMLEFLQKTFPSISFSKEVGDHSGDKFYLRYLFCKKGPKANELEKKLKFLILYDAEKVSLDDDLRTRLWCEVIQKYTMYWVDLIPPDQKQDWNELKEDNMVMINEESVELRLGTSKTHVQALPIDTLDRSAESVYILLVDDSVMSSQLQGHFSTSKETQDRLAFKGAGSKPYHGHISINKDQLTVEWGDFMREGMVNESENSIYGPIKKCKARRFKSTSSGSYRYAEHCVIDCVESGDEGNLLIPAHEFKLFTQAVNTDAFLQKFCIEVIRFACACINSRKNGTIHFGIADENPEKAERYKLRPCEIVGVPVFDKSQYKDALTQYINRCFDEENREFARKCIWIPEFITVEQSSAKTEMRYVIEVDIEASYEYTRGKLFSVALPSISDSKKSKIFHHYVRNGSQSSMISDRNCESYQKDMERIDAKRKQEELQLGKMFQNMTRQLQHMLEEDCGRLDDTYKRILVLSSMDPSILSQEFLSKKASILSNIPWSFVVDFNSANKTESGLCQILTEDSDFEIHDVEEFNNEAMIQNGLSPAWVFGNGVNGINSPLAWEKWQLSERASGLEDLIKKARNEFPPNRTIIMFIIKPGFTKIEAITYGMFLRHFGENAVCFYIEDDEIETAWKDVVVNDLRYINEHKLLSRGILGLPWEEFKEEIGNLTTSSQKGTIKIPMTENTLCSIERGYFNDKSVQIMDSEECQYLHELFQHNRKRFDREKQESEVRFYRGQQVSMENFWFTQNGAKHVIERDVLKKLTECFEYVLSMDPSTSPGVETIKLLYSRGSGGTTVATHFLWMLFHSEAPYKARCCIVNSIKPETISTIYNFSKHRNPSRLPTVVLVDDQQDSDVQMLMKGLSEKILNSGAYFKCIPIILLRVEPSSHPRDEAREGDPWLCTSLDYHLSDKEHVRFYGKYVDMQRVHGDGFEKFAEETLPSFIMMMQRSRKDRETYAERIVNSALPEVNDNEKAMLKYLSLIHFSVPENKYIYIASFDPIMASIAFRKERYQVNWAKNLSASAEIFLRFKDLPVSDDAYPEQEPGVSLMFLEFAEAILKWAHKHDQQTIGDIALDFMNCAAFPSTNEIRRVNEFVRCLYYKMYLALQSKKKPTSGRKREIFSKLISTTLQKEKNVSKVCLDKALALMKLGFEKMDRLVLAQQVARLSYIHGSQIEEEREKYFEIAETWVQRALSKRKDSYFLDTAGRIRLCRLKVAFPKQRGSKRHPKLDGVEDCLKALDLCLDSIKWFQDSQKAEQLCKTLNVAGYYGEMQAMIFFLSILSNSKVFQYDSENVRKYVCLPKWTPKQVPWTKEQGKQIKRFRERFLFCHGKVEQIYSVLKIEDEFDTYAFDGPFSEYFVLCDHPEEQSDDFAKWTQNWMSIQTHIGGSIFKNVFNINHTKERSLRDPNNLEDLKEIGQKLQENLKLDVEENLKFKDVFLLISVKMASYSPFRKQPPPKESAVAELLETKENMKALLQKQESIDGRLKSYCLLFSFMLQWPHDNPGIQTDANWQQQYEKTLRKLEAMATALQRTYQKPDTDTGEEFGRRQRLQHSPRYSSVTTLFYLGRGQGLDMYVHVNELPLTKRRNHAIDWDHPSIAGRLKCLSGKRISDRTIEYTTADNAILKIEVAARSRVKYSLEEVSFYLGFSWKGPLACGVKLQRELKS